MLFISSLFIVFAYSLYFFIGPHFQATGPLSRCIPMILGMTSSVVIGIIVALWLPQMLAASTIIAILLSAITAILIGRRFGMNGIMEAQAASFMGSMMGAMLGDMLSIQEGMLMVVVMDAIYLVSVYLMLLLQRNQGLLKHKPFFLSLAFLLSVGLIGAAGLLQVNQAELKSNPVNHQHEH